jgi:hypothetical protein
MSSSGIQKPGSYFTGDITLTLQSTVSQCYVRFKVFTSVTMENAVVWDVIPCGSCMTDASEEFSASIIRVTRIGELGKSARGVGSYVATGRLPGVLLFTGARLMRRALQ